MATEQEHSAPVLAGLDTVTAQRLRRAKVLIAGVGNIGSHLALQLGRMVAVIYLLDRDRVEAKNLGNQDYLDPQEIGNYKVDVVGKRLRRAFPFLRVVTISQDLEDVPLGVFAGLDLCLGGLDSLRARQLFVSERAYPLGIPTIDGAVGEPLLGQVQVIIPGEACLECCWQPAHYQQLGREVSCIPGAAAGGPPTLAPAFLGATVAGLMCSEAVRLLGNSPVEKKSRQIALDMVNQRLLVSNLRRNEKCRFDHQMVRERWPLGKMFTRALVRDLVAMISRRFGHEQWQLEVRRGAAVCNGHSLFGAARFLTPATLLPLADKKLSELSWTKQDLPRVRAGERSVFVDLAASG